MAKYETALNGDEEQAFAAWKAKVAPKDDGSDYDLRGAFKAGVVPNQQGHWPDTFKKPNHPTFSNESIYAKDAPEKAGQWVPGPNGTKTYVGANGRTDANLQARMGGDGRTIAGTETGAFRDADKAAFDSRFTANGTYDPYKADRLAFPKPSASIPASPAQTGSAQTVGSGAAAAAPVVAPVPKSGIGVLSGIPGEFNSAAALTNPPKATFGGKPLDLSLASNAPAVPRTPNATALAVGETAGRVLTRAGDLAKTAAGGFMQGESAVGGPLADAASYAMRPFTAVANAEKTAVGAVRDAASAVPGVVNDVATGLGRTLPSGVSRSQVADFRQPTKANPIPVTPTSPVANVDKSQESISRFGLTEDEFAKNKLAFSGF
jgi:hypothetical protein